MNLLQPLCVSEVDKETPTSQRYVVGKMRKIITSDTTLKLNKRKFLKDQLQCEMISMNFS